MAYTPTSPGEVTAISSRGPLSSFLTGVFPSLFCLLVGSRTRSTHRLFEADPDHSSSVRQTLQAREDRQHSGSHVGPSSAPAAPSSFQHLLFVQLGRAGLPFPGRPPQSPGSRGLPLSDPVHAPALPSALPPPAELVLPPPDTLRNLFPEPPEQVTGSCLILPATHAPFTWRTRRTRISHLLSGSSTGACCLHCVLVCSLCRGGRPRTPSYSLLRPPGPGGARARSRGSVSIRLWNEQVNQRLCAQT